MRLLFIPLIVLGLAVPVAAAEKVWTGGVGDWAQAANWDDGVPEAGDDALVGNGGTAQVSGAAEFSTLTVNGTSTVEVAATGDMSGSALTAGDTGGGTLRFKFGGTGPGSVELAEQLALGAYAELELELTDVPPGESVTLITAGSVSGTFVGLSGGDIISADYDETTYDWRISYDGGVVLTPVEELAILLRTADDEADYEGWNLGSGKDYEEIFVMDAGNAVLVKNYGSIAIDISLSATGTNWTLSDTVGADQCVLMGLFNGAAAPSAGDFNVLYDVVTGVERWATYEADSSGFYQGLEAGINIAPGQGETLYMYLQTPSSVSTGDPETITVTVGCKAH